MFRQGINQEIQKTKKKFTGAFAKLCMKRLLQTFEGLSPGTHILFPPATMQLTEISVVINTQSNTNSFYSFS